jgi:hypothetical protein
MFGRIKELFVFVLSVLHIFFVLASKAIFGGMFTGVPAAKW